MHVLIVLLYVAAPHAGGKVPAEKILTDGCGFMNWAALAAIARALKYTRFPTAVQGRIAGSKGVWTLHPHDRSPDDPPRIWVRPSQQKIKHFKLTLSHCIFELVAPPRVSVPSRLSRHTLMVLSHNAVSDEALVSLMEAGIDEEVRALSAFDDSHLLRATVAEVGRIFAARLQRLASGSARLFGLGREWGQDSDQQEEEEDPEHGQLGTLVDRNEYSGEPVKVHERASEMLAAGFRPQENPILFKSLRDIISYRITELIREYHITVPRSADAFIVPDPYGVLEPGEIHFRASDDLKDPLDGPGANQITGNVLSFEGSATTDPPENFLKDNFQSQEHIQQVSEVLEDMKSCSTAMREPCLQQALLVAYLYGLAHKHTLHNAWMFNTVLDSKKTGLIVKESVFHEDTNHYGHAQPPCMKPIAGVDEETEQGHLGYTRPCPQRDGALPPFILDQLLTAGKALETRFLQSFETLQPTSAHSFDADLSKPWADADSWATRLQEQRRYAEPRNDLQQIHRHVEKHVRLWQLAAGKSTATPSRTRRKRTASVAKPSDDFKLIAKSFADGPENVVFYDVKTICTLKASCAYKTNPKFAFSVAFYDLCRIKAESFGIAPQTREFADMMAVPSSVRRILTQKASGL
ncbi:hypothetical protein EVJ58_g4444 [Rhodofomes roseus]|uniref:RNA-dependent RNA polymerase n=1 Tax=Rhodofomes roseus TaxID=34475 RepID=A0A4Y9YIX9_9APHY|nr:hypothetical protein EVJ58_g4444 [Rhodofomes roseus]